MASATAETTSPDTESRGTYPHDSVRSRSFLLLLVAVARGLFLLADVTVMPLTEVSPSPIELFPPIPGHGLGWL